MSHPEGGGHGGHETKAPKAPIKPLRSAVGSGVPEGARRPRAIGNRGRVGIGVGVIATLLAGEAIQPVERIQGAVESHFGDDEKEKKEAKPGEGVQDSKTVAQLRSVEAQTGKKWSDITLDDVRTAVKDWGVDVDPDALWKKGREGAIALADRAVAAVGGGAVEVPGAAAFAPAPRAAERPAPVPAPAAPRAVRAAPAPRATPAATSRPSPAPAASAEAARPAPEPPPAPAVEVAPVVDYAALDKKIDAFYAGGKYLQALTELKKLMADKEAPAQLKTDWKERYDWLSTGEDSPVKGK